MYTPVFLLAACGIGALAKTTTSAAQTDGTTTATVLIGSITSGLAGSVISADACDTTYAFTCTDSLQCSGYDLTFTVTEGPTDYQFQYSTSTGGAEGIYSESCSLSGSSPSVSALCTASVELSANGSKTAQSTTVSASGADLHYGQFPITAGVDKLASATGSCTATSNAAAATGVSEVYKVLVVPAAAAALAAGVFA